MPKSYDEDVNYDGYRYKKYAWHEHGREDLPRKQRARTHAPENKPIKKRRATLRVDKQGVFVVFTILICFSITFFIAEAAAGGSVLNFLGADADNKQSESYFAVSVASYDDMSTASIISDELRLLGGAGYVYFDQRYYVIASIYSSHADAQKVAERLTGYDASVCEITISPPSLKWCRTADKAAVEGVLEYASAAFMGLYDIAVALDGGKIAESQAYSRIGVLYRDINTLTAKLDKITVDSTEFALVRLRAEIAAAKAMLENLKNSSLARYNLVSDVRYTAVAIIVGYKSLTPNI